jgi:nitroimidazol reductase NimA-like FMN-containing flavoprotein (pyridoxamine 5'-phosphate oxidase superfamily)
MAYTVLEVLSRGECLSLLPRSRVGRIGVSIGALPAILPVNYILIGDSVLFRTSGDSELLSASVGSLVAFEVDDYDEDGRFGWSVLIRGIALELTDRVEIELAHRLWLEAWPLGERANRFVIVPAANITGRRFARVR